MSEEEFDPYKVLGVESDATIEEIDRAYKRRAMETHPDQNPTKEEEFKLVQRAISILRDPEKRKRYDDGFGDYDDTGIDNVRARAIAIVTKLFIEVIGAMPDVIYQDPIDVTKLNLSIRRNKVEEKGIALDTEYGKLQVVEKRLSTTNKENVLLRTVESRMRTNRVVKKGIVRELEAADVALQILEEYKYNLDGMYLLIGGTSNSSTSSSGFTHYTIRPM